MEIITTKERTNQTKQTISNYQPLPSDEVNDSESPDIEIEAGQKVKLAVYIYSFCAALNSCNLGYDIGINTNAAKLIHQSMGLTDIQLELLMGSVNLFAMLGALCSQFTMDYLGRRKAFQMSAVVFLVGILIMAAAPNYVTLVSGRVFVGLGIGLGMAIDSLYISEISPASHRGRLVTLTGIAINTAVLIGFSFGLIFSQVPANLAWRYMYAMGSILPCVMIFFTCFVIPESPRWLVQNGRDEEARDVLSRLYPENGDVEIVFQEMIKSVGHTEEDDVIGWKNILFPSPAFRRILLVGIATAIAQQTVGIDVIQYYLVYILEESAIHSRATQGLILIFLGVIKVGFVTAAGYLFDVVGRKPLFYASLSGMIVALFILSINFSVEEPRGVITVFALALYVSFYSFGMGPGAWLIPSEVFPTSIRGKALSLATFFNRVTGTIMVSSCLSIVNSVSWALFFLLLAFVCLMVAEFFFFFVPETKGKSLEDMTLYFANITGDKSILESRGEGLLQLVEYGSVNASAKKSETN